MNNILFKAFKTIILIFFCINLQAQQDGYWDKERTTNKNIVVSAGEKIIIKSEHFPVGTTEIVYRITLLDENQEMASSLVSVLKSIPDPSGISQGSAGAVLLLSKIAGNDKCKYAIFKTEKQAAAFKLTGKQEAGCLYQKNPINKEAKLLSLNKSSCLSLNTENLYFGFESKNLIMNQKIILEIVPWVDNKLSRGWNLQNRKTTFEQCIKSEIGKKLKNQDNYCACQLEKLQEKFKFFEFNNLLPQEKNSNLETISKDCLAKTGDNQVIDNTIRTQIDSLIKSEKYDLSIEKLQNIVKKGNAIAADFNNLSTCYLLTKQFQKALVNSKKAIAIDDSDLAFQLNLAHAFMYTNNLTEAKIIHENFKNQNINSTLGWVEKTKIDFEYFLKAGFSNENFNKILRIIE